jgi:hypothetical protein
MVANPIKRIQLVGTYVVGGGGIAGANPRVGGLSRRAVFNSALSTVSTYGEHSQCM